LFGEKYQKPRIKVWNKWIHYGNKENNNCSTFYDWILSNNCTK
jgi:hypothetical protein